MTKEESLAFLNECIKELELSTEEDRKRMREIYKKERQAQEEQCSINIHG